MIRSYKNEYASHKHDALSRGIDFLLTYGEWLQIWVDSGHLHERGHKIGQYVMARFGDMGPYSRENIKIITCSENISEGQFGKPKSEETRKRMSKPKSMEHRAKIAQRNKERAALPEERKRLVLHCAKLSAAKRQLTDEQVAEIQNLYTPEFKGSKMLPELAKKYGVSYVVVLAATCRKKRVV